MTRDQALNILECSAHASQDDIKTAYRKLSKKYHPDLNPGNSSHDMFVRVKSAFDFLNSNNKGYSKPVDKSAPKYYRILTDLGGHISLPLKTIEQETIIYCMYKDSEFRITLPKGMILPTQINIKNVFRVPFMLKIVPDSSVT